MNRINISKNARIKAGSELVYPHKVNPSATVCNLYELSLERQLVGLEKKWSVRLTGAGMPSFPQNVEFAQGRPNRLHDRIGTPFNRTAIGKKKGSPHEIRYKSDTKG